jgi:serine/threonine protein kinase
VSIGITLASALAHLHKYGLVHRDVKPSNIIFVGGVPKLADIGLVTDASEARSFVGTVGFIPPEGPGSAQADLYSLGKVLYEISTGQDRQDFPQLPPDLLRRGANAECGVRSAESLSVATPSNPQPAIRNPQSFPLIELNEVLLKACHKDLRQRYPSADAMLADLELLQRGQSVQRKHAAERRFALAKKFSLAAAALALLLAGGWFTTDRFGQLSRRSPNGQLPKSWKPSPEAEKFYKEGWGHLLKQSRDGITRSIESFNHAIELEPNYALAYCGLSDAYFSQSDTVAAPIQALPEARKNARQAVKIDDSLPDGHLNLGRALMGAYDFAGAESEFKRAVALGPSNGWARTCYATLLRCVGRTEQAREFQKKAFELEPSERIRLRDWYYQLWSERKFFEAAQQGEQLSQVASNWVMTPWLLGRAYAACGRLEEAARELRRTRTMDDDPDGAGALGYVYGRMGKTNEARAVLLELQTWRGNRYVCAHDDAYVYAGLGETAEAIRQLHLAYESQCRALTSLKYEPFWDDLRTDSRFIELLKKVSLEK